MLGYIANIAYAALAWNIYWVMKPNRIDNLKNCIWLEDQKEFHMRMTEYYDVMIRSHPLYMNRKKTE